MNPSISFQRFSKPIINQIDRVLAQQYGFTAEELDNLGSSATRDTVGQSSTDGNNHDIGSARLEAQTLTVQAVPP